MQGYCSELPFTRPTPRDTISLSYSHRILQGVLDFSLSQEHIPPAHPPKHALKSRDALPVNHTSHEAVGRRARWGTLLHAMGWKALRQRREVRGEVQTWQTHSYAMLCQKGSQSLLPKTRRGLMEQLRNWIQSDIGTRLNKFRREHVLETSECPASLLFWQQKWMWPRVMEGWSTTYPSLKGVPLPISLGSRRDEDSSNKSGSAICWWCNSAWIHKSINI